MGEKNFELDMSCVRARHPTFQPGNIDIRIFERKPKRKSQAPVKDTMGI